ncbi:hypothetical protein JCM5350_004151 [Sporobolomyces pararoseus]
MPPYHPLSTKHRRDFHPALSRIVEHKSTPTGEGFPQPYSKADANLLHKSRYEAQHLVEEGITREPKLQLTTSGWFKRCRRIKPAFQALPIFQNLHGWRCAEINVTINLLHQDFKRRASSGSDQSWEEKSEKDDDSELLEEWEEELKSTLKDYLSASKDPSIAWTQIQYEMSRLELLRGQPYFRNNCVSPLFDPVNILLRVKEWKVSKTHKVDVHRLSSLPKNRRMSRRFALIYNVNEDEGF